MFQKLFLILISLFCCNLSIAQDLFLNKMPIEINKKILGHLPTILYIKNICFTSKDMNKLFTEALIDYSKNNEILIDVSKNGGLEVLKYLNASNSPKPFLRLKIKGVTKAGIYDLLNLFKNVLSLDLSGNRIGNKGAKALAESTALTGLKYLNLANNNISNDVESRQ